MYYLFQANSYNNLGETMNKINEIKELYKNNKKLFNVIFLVVNVVLIFWQSIFTLIMPGRANVFILLILIGALVYQLVKNA